MLQLQYNVISSDEVDSTKSAEQAQRTGGKEITEYCEGDITEDVPLPSDMECFWPSESNKVEQQAFARVHIAEKILQNYDFIVSGVILLLRLERQHHYIDGYGSYVCA